MAIRYREKYKTWQVYYRHPVTKKIVSKSFATKQEAEKENALIVYQLQYERERFAEKEVKEESQEQETQVAAPTLDSLYVDYLKEKQFSKKSLASQWYKLKKIMARFGGTCLADIDDDVLNEIVDYVKSFDISGTSQQAYLRIVRALIYFGIRRKMVKPLKFPAMPKGNYKKFVPPTAEEISKMYAVAPDYLRRVIILGAYFGVRVGPCEMYQLTWDDVDLERRILRVHGSKKNANCPWREVPIRDSLLAIFADWQAKDLASGATYLVECRGKQVKKIHYLWDRTLTRAGITRHIRPYDLRHAFGTELIAAGVDVGTVAKLMGHSNPTMLLTHYQYVMDRQKRNAVELLPDLDIKSCMSQGNSDIQDAVANPRQ